MTARTTLDDLVGKELPLSGWRTVDQETVDRFAAVTGDDQWIHVDRERAKASPFGTTIVHGYLTLSLAPVLLGEIIDLTQYGTVVNYGIGRLRFPAPLPVGSRIRLHASVASVERMEAGATVALRLTFERDGGDRPVCVAEVLYRLLGVRDRSPERDDAREMHGAIL
jgi:acyl dehydratase